MRKRYPVWLRKRLMPGGNMQKVQGLLKDLQLHTVCESALCPNLGECFSRRTATFMILGDVCTRNCRFCAVAGGEPQPVDPCEPEHIAAAVVKLNLKYAVLTSVTRDDLPDQGVDQFIKTVAAIKAAAPATMVEILTPDFSGRGDLLNRIAAADWQVFNHNVETVPRLYEAVRPEADYQRSLQVLAHIKGSRPRDKTKSGLMVGLGETKAEVVAVMADLLAAGCDLLTIGQYLQPAPSHLPIEEFITPEQFAEYKRIGEEMGFEGIASAPFVRSSYRADELI